MQHIYKPSPELLKEVRAELVKRGTSLNKYCSKHGYLRQAVSAALNGTRNGAKSKELARQFLREVYGEQ